MAGESSGAQVHMIAARALMLEPGGAFRVAVNGSDQATLKMITRIEAAIADEHHHGGLLFPALSSPSEIKVRGIRTPTAAHIVIERAATELPTFPKPAKDARGRSRRQKVGPPTEGGKAAIQISARTVHHQGIPVLRLADELDIAGRTDLNEIVREFEGLGDCLIVDLRDVAYMDSSSLGVLIGLHVRMSEKDGAVAIAYGATGLGRLFELAGLGGTLKTFESLDDAAAYLVTACPPQRS